MGPETPFSYRCTRCNSCCIDKLIQVNPYEIARLARNRGVSTGEAREQFTIEGKLRQDDGGACVFLGEAGCTVHPDRPLVCRLFPLGRVIDDQGNVRFRPFPDPLAAHGDFGEEETIADYIAAQGAADYIVAADAYFGFYLRANKWVEAGLPDEAADDDLLDIDSQLTAYCAARGIAEPAGLEERARLHIERLDALLGDDGR